MIPTRAIRFGLGATALGAMLLATPPAARADGALFTVEGAQPVRENLKGRVKQSVTLRLVGTEKEITGTVVAVGENAVHLTQIGGMEFYDALVRLDEIQAVLVRRPAQ
ncbi:MAG: hypothetical protein U0610_06420 [bacterium]